MPLEEFHRVAEFPDYLLDRDDALTRFAAAEPDKARLVQLRFFATGALYDVEADVGESTGVAPANPDVVQRLRGYAAGMAADLGAEAIRPGPGIRPPGRVAAPQTLRLPERRVASRRDRPPRTGTDSPGIRFHLPCLSGILE